MSRPFPYPNCWNDDARMDVLFAPFRLKAVNPENYVSKMKFWQELITKYCEHKGNPCFNKRELQLAFIRNEKVPYGLDTVLDELLQDGKIRSQAEFMYDPVNTWTGWAITSFVRKPLTWGLHKITANYEDGKAVDYILLDMIKKFCNEMHTNILQNHMGKVMHYDALRTLIQNAMHLNEEGIRICLHTLHSEKRIGIEYIEENNDRRIHLIKIPHKMNGDIQITDSERAIHNLKMTEINLTEQLDDLENNIKINDEKVRQHLKDGKRQLAKTYLRKKHLLEKNYEKRSIALNNVETLLASVEEAQSNGVILDAYKIGSKALQNVLNESGLKYDNVDEIISDVKETIDNHEEIKDAIGNANLMDTGVDEYELENELKDILGETTKKTAAASKPISQSVSKIKVTASPVENNNQPVVAVVSSTNVNNNKSLTVSTPSDEELLALLNDLEIETKDPHKSIKEKSPKELLE